MSIVIADFDKDVLRTLNKDIPKDKELLVAGLGLCGESGEVGELIKKHEGHAHPLDKDKVIKELGDVAFYLSWVAQLAGSSLHEVLTKNIEKRRERYPLGFTPEASMNRTEYKTTE